MSLHLTHTGQTVLFLVLLIVLLSMARKMGRLAFIIVLVLAVYLLLIR